MSFVARPTPDQRLVSVMVAIPIRHLDLIAGTAAHSTELDIAILVRDDEGRSSRIRWDFLPITIPNEHLSKALRGGAGYVLDLEVRSWPQVLALAVHDRASGKNAIARIRVSPAAR